MAIRVNLVVVLAHLVVISGHLAEPGGTWWWPFFGATSRPIDGITRTWWSRRENI